VAANRPLAGVAVLVTRPKAQAAHLSGLISSAGGLPVELPALAICPPADPEAAREAFARVAEFEIAIFVSANAATAALRLAHELNLDVSAPALFAVGAATARCLQNAGVEGVYVPKGNFSSEGLLAMPQLQSTAIRGRAILIVRGEGGREVLAPELSARGARVSSAILYRRSRPQIGVQEIRRIVDARRPDILIATSGEALENLADMLVSADRAALLTTPLVVAAERMCKLARAEGFQNVAGVADSPRDEDMLRMVIDWAKHR